MPNFKPNICPNCGREMIKGQMSVVVSSITINSSASLRWESEEKHPQKSINPFLKGKMVLKKISKTLMGDSSHMADPKEGWYCPDCEQVFACFKLEKK